MPEMKPLAQDLGSALDLVTGDSWRLPPLVEYLSMSRSAVVGRWPLFPSVLQAARLAKFAEPRGFHGVSVCKLHTHTRDCFLRFTATLLRCGEQDLNR